VVVVVVVVQVKERIKNHEMRNQARKLTPEERREKKRKKLLEEKAKELRVAVFRVRDPLANPQIRYKIDVNAQQYYLTGSVLQCKDPRFGDTGLNMVVVEGGPKAVRR
jgi:U4/U6 small nuclear ribonucleoprotein PRP3